MLERLHTRGRVNNLGKAHAEPFAHHDNLALGNHRPVGKDIQWIACKPVKLDDRAFIQPQQVTDLDLGLADLNRQGDIDILKKPHVFGTDPLGGGRIHCLFSNFGFFSHGSILSNS